MNTNTNETQGNHRRFFLTTALVAAPLLLALAALGCGEQKGKATAELATQETTHPAVQGASAPNVTVAGTGQVQPGLGPESTGSSQTDVLPPDIVAAGPESIVVPGSVVTVAATGSADVTSVMLTDRAGEKTPFTYDSESNLWKASYRVPLRVATDKLGLAVTATTEANRYKRVWVFLRLRDEVAAPAEATPDSAR